MHCSHKTQLKSLGGFGVFVISQKPLSENANKSYHVYKVTVVHVTDFGSQITRISCKPKPHQSLSNKLVNLCFLF